MPRVSIIGELKKYDLKEGEILFDGLEKQGLELPHGCLAGSCGACRIEVIEGDQMLENPSAMEQNTLDAIKKNFERINGSDSLKDKTIRLSCRAKIKGDVTICPFN